MTYQPIKTDDNNYLTPRIESSQLENNPFALIGADNTSTTSNMARIPDIRTTGNSLCFMEGQLRIVGDGISEGDDLMYLPEGIEAACEAFQRFIVLAYDPPTDTTSFAGINLSSDGTFSALEDIAANIILQLDGIVFRRK